VAIRASSAVSTVVDLNPFNAVDDEGWRHRKATQQDAEEQQIMEQQRYKQRRPEQETPPQRLNRARDSKAMAPLDSDNRDADNDAAVELLCISRDICHLEDERTQTQGKSRAAGLPNADSADIVPAHLNGDSGCSTQISSSSSSSSSNTSGVAFHNHPGTETAF